MAKLFEILVKIVLTGLCGVAAVVVAAVLYGCVLGIVQTVKKERGNHDND